MHVFYVKKRELNWPADFFCPSEWSQLCYGYTPWLTQSSIIKPTVHPFPLFKSACCKAPYIRTMLLLPSLWFPNYQKSRWTKPLGSHLHWPVANSVPSDRHVFTARHHERGPPSSLKFVKWDYRRQRRYRVPLPRQEAWHRFTRLETVQKALCGLPYSGRNYSHGRTGWNISVCCFTSNVI